MSITITVSEKTELRLREIAHQRGQDVSEVAEDIIEKNISEEPPAPKRRRKFSEMAGMFNSGERNTAENASEILRSELGESSRGEE